jgi:hypothetical protein
MAGSGPDCHTVFVIDKHVDKLQRPLRMDSQNAPRANVSLSIFTRLASKRVYKAENAPQCSISNRFSPIRMMEPPNSESKLEIIQFQRQFYDHDYYRFDTGTVFKIPWSKQTKRECSEVEVKT